MKRIRIGRSKNNDFTIENTFISSNHAELIQYDDCKVTIRDLNSKNGTFINGQKVSTETELHPGDIVKLAGEQLDWKSLLDKTIIQGGAGSGESIPPDVIKKVLLGRGSEADKKYSQSVVSSKHATLYKKKDGSVEIVDNNSTNGTYVNGQKISHAVLRHGDIVSLAGIANVDWENIIGVVPQRPVVRPYLKYIAIFIGIVILLGGGYLLYQYIIKPSKETELSSDEIYAKYKKSVALIYYQYAFRVTVGEYDLSDIIPALSDNYIINEKGMPVAGVKRVSGTGFFISQDGKIATNKHVVTLMGNESKIANYIKAVLSTEILNYYGSQARSLVNAMNVEYVSSISIAMNDAYLNSDKDLIPCTLLKTSDNNDLDIAVIQINNKQTPSSVVNIIDMDSISTDEDISMGKKLYTIGFPHGISWGQTEKGLQATLESGNVNQTVSEFLYGHNLNITHGASGSPVFDTKGRFAGIIVSGYDYRAVSSDGRSIEVIPSQHNQGIKPVPAVKFIKSIN